jgi:FixJ family two-component response regulator
MPGKTVFVVDDDAAVRQGLRFMLRAAGYSVEAFTSARSFLEGYDPRRGGCVLLDVRMPQMTGLELQQAQCPRLAYPGYLHHRSWYRFAGHCSDEVRRL